MLESIKKNLSNLFKFSSKKEEQEDYSTKLSNTHNIRHIFVYKNERLLRLNNIGNYLWYCYWDKDDVDASIYYLEFLQFVDRSTPIRVYVVLDQIHILLSLNVKDMSNIYDNYIEYSVNHIQKPNIFIQALLEDISLEIPQSYIQGKLNKAITYHRTTLDGELDEDFNPVKNSESKFPIHIQSDRYIVEADSIYNIRDSISYVSQALNIFVSDQELLLFGHIMLQLDKKTYLITRLSDVWEELPTLLIEENLIQDKQELDDYMNTLISTCTEHDIPLIIEDSQKSPVIYPEDSNEEVIEETFIKEEPKDQ